MSDWIDTYLRDAEQLDPQQREIVRLWLDGEIDVAVEALDRRSPAPRRLVAVRDD
jgi:hypothetical protein